MTGERRGKGKKKGKGSVSDTAAEVAHSRYEGLESPGDEFSKPSSKWRSTGSTGQQTAESHSGRWLSCILVVSVLVAVGSVACVFYSGAIIRTLEEYGVKTDSIVSGLGLYLRSVSEDASAVRDPDVQATAREAPSSPTVDDFVTVEKDANILPGGHDDLPADATSKHHEPVDAADSEEPLTAEAAETYAADRPEGGEAVPTAASVDEADDDVVLSVGNAQDDRLPLESLLADEDHLPEATFPSGEDQVSTEGEPAPAISPSDQDQVSTDGEPAPASSPSDQDRVSTDGEPAPASSPSDQDQVSTDGDQTPVYDASADTANSEQEREEAPSSGEHRAETESTTEPADLPRPNDLPNTLDEEGTARYFHDDYKEADTEAADVGAGVLASPALVESHEDVYLNEQSDYHWHAPEEELAETRVPEELGHLAESGAVEDAELSQPGAATVVDDNLPAETVWSPSEAETVDDGELPFQGDVESDATLNEIDSEVDGTANDLDTTGVDADDSTQQQTLTFAEEQLLLKDQGGHIDGAGPLQSSDAGDTEGESMAPAPPGGFSRGDVEAESIAVAPTEWEFLDAAVGSGSPDAVYIDGADSASPDEESSERAPAVDAANDAEDLKNVNFEAVASSDTSDFVIGERSVDHDESAPAASALDSTNVDPESDDQEPLISSSWDRGEAASGYPTSDDIVHVNDDDMARSIESASAYVDDGNLLRLRDDEATGMAEAASGYMEEGDMFRTRRNEPANGNNAASEYVDDKQIHQTRVDDIANPGMAGAFSYSSSDPDSEGKPASSEPAADVDDSSHSHEDDNAWSRASAAAEAESGFVDGYVDTEAGSEPASGSTGQSGGGDHSEVDNEAWTRTSAADSASDPNIAASSFSDSEGDYQPTDEDRSDAYE